MPLLLFRNCTAGDPRLEPTHLCAQTALRTLGFPFFLFLTLFLSLTEALLSLKFIWICPHDLHESWMLIRESVFKLKDLILIRKKTCEYSGQPRTEPQWGPKRPLCASSIFLHGSVYRDGRRKVPRKCTGYLFAWFESTAFSPEGRCLLLPWGGLWSCMPAPTSWTRCSEHAFTCLAPHGPLYHLSAPKDFSSLWARGLLFM